MGDSSTQPENYRLKSGGAVKATALQMWARGQRYLHHSCWDRSSEYLVLPLATQQISSAGQNDTSTELRTGEVAADPVWDPEDDTEHFREGYICVRVQSDNM